MNSFTRSRFKLSTSLLALFALILAVMLLPIAALGQSTPAAEVSATYLYDVKDRTSTPVALVKIGEIKDVLKSRLSLDVSTFAGAKAERPILGTWISLRQPIARNLDVSFGPAITYEASRFKSPGLILGFSLRL
jgi:hypothetical protein